MCRSESVAVGCFGFGPLATEVADSGNGLGRHAAKWAGRADRKLIETGTSWSYSRCVRCRASRRRRPRYTPRMEIVKQRNSLTFIDDPKEKLMKERMSRWL